MAEIDYKILMEDVALNNGDVEEFCKKFIELFTKERESGELKTYDPKFQRMLLMMMLSCDSYAENPTELGDMSKDEIIGYASILAFTWWGKD